MNLRRIGEILVFIFAFLCASYLAHQYQEQIRLLLGSGGVMSQIVFIALTALFVVFVIPLDIVFLIPIGTHVWGPVTTALLSILGWIVGASVAFWVARTWGLPIVLSLIGEKRVEKLHQFVPHENLFWSVLLLRMLVPVDLLSYALGLFTRMRWHEYIMATLIGVSPFGFFFAYAGTLPSWYQLFAILGAFLLVSLILLQYKKHVRELGYDRSRIGFE